MACQADREVKQSPAEIIISQYRVINHWQEQDKFSTFSCFKENLYLCQMQSYSQGIRLLYYKLRHKGHIST